MDVYSVIIAANQSQTKKIIFKKSNGEDVQNRFIKENIN